MTVQNKCESEYLAGNFAPVGDEMDETRLEVTGALPSALSGLYLRNGPNPMFEPLGQYHWFDGDGMVHAIRIADGKASYKNRWVQSRGLQNEKRVGHAVYGGMQSMSLTDPALVGEVPVKNTANTNVIRFQDRILCLMEGSLPTELSADLDTIGEYDFGGKLASAFSAHPHIDPRTGEMLSFGYVPNLKYLRVSAEGELLQVEDIPVPRPTMMHDFSFTEKHAIFFDAPAVLDYESFFAGGPMIKWDPDNGTRIGVLPREGKGSDIRWFEIPNAYCVHFMNSWEEDGKITIDAPRFNEMDFGTSEPGALPDPDGFLTRFTIDLDTERVSIDRIGELPGEFPRVRAEIEGARHRFGVSGTFAKGVPSGPRFDSVTLYDFEKGTEKTHAFGDGEIAGEALFAPDPKGTAENDGWILSLVSDAGGAHTDMVVLDAHDLTETARIHMPRRVPFGFHGNWLPDGNVNMQTPPAG